MNNSAVTIELDEPTTGSRLRTDSLPKAANLSNRESIEHCTVNPAGLDENLEKLISRSEQYSQQDESAGFEAFNEGLDAIPATQGTSFSVVGSSRRLGQFGLFGSSLKAESPTPNTDNTPSPGAPAA